MVLDQMRKGLVILLKAMIIMRVLLEFDINEQSILASLINDIGYDLDLF